VTDEEILAEIGRVLSSSETKISKRARLVGLHILEKGYATASAIRRSLTRAEHVWQAKSELNVLIPVSSEEREPDTHEVMYKFDLDKIRSSGIVLQQADQARTLTAKQRREIEAKYNNQCVFCHTQGAKLQVEHLIPFGISGNENGMDWLALACPSCNRRKGYACKHQCPNWSKSDAEVCKRCFWGSPDDYDHVATKPQILVLETFSDSSEIEAFKQARSKLSSREALLKFSIHS